MSCVTLAASGKGERWEKKKEARLISSASTVPQVAVEDVDLLE